MNRSAFSAKLIGKRIYINISLTVVIIHFTWFGIENQSGSGFFT